MGSLSYSSAIPILSGNAGELTYTLDAGETLHLIVTDDGVELASFELKAIADGNSHTLELAEVLDALPLATADLPSSDDGSITTVLSEVTLRIVDSNNDMVDEATFPAVKGFIMDRSVDADDAADILAEKLLSQAPQIRKTYPGALEFLAIAWAGLGNISGTYKIKKNITVYYADGQQGNIVLNDSLDQSQTWLCVLNMSKAWIEGHDSGEGGHIVAWDVALSITRTAHGATGALQTITIRTYPTVRYVVHNGRTASASFAFVNDLGGVDSIHAIGGFRLLGGYEPSEFINGRLRRSLDTNPDTLFEASSGPISTAEERRLWLAFLRSAEKYYIPAGGEPEKISMSEASPEFSAGELNEATFKFRREYERGGVLPTFTNLPEYTT